MNVLLLFLPALAIYFVGYHFYSRFLENQWGVDEGRTTPAVLEEDGRDFVPTRRPILFAHHFATVTGAAPIVGPTTAMLYGTMPAFLWVVFGAVFIGAVHDFSCLFVSVRNGGQSVAQIARERFGLPAYGLFISFLIVLIVIINAVFLWLTAQSLTSEWPAAKLDLPAGQEVLSTFINSEGVELARIGGIASMSVVVITLCSPLLGWLFHKRRLPLVWAYLFASVVAISSIYIGFLFPIVLTPGTWQAVFSGYILLACGLPVWLILQPRDFTDVQILYGGLTLLAVSLLVAGLGGLTIRAPMQNFAQASSSPMGFVWPGLFITIACGAVSGFHGIVASGTTSKQLANESDARRIGYLAMIGESTLGLCVILAIAGGIAYSDYLAVVWPSEGASNPILGFALGAAGLFEAGLGIPRYLGAVFGILLVEGFVITTLDTSVRLNRYLFEELWRVLFGAKTPRLLLSPWLNAGLAVFLMFFVASTGAFRALWPLFGSANQLLAGLSLVVVTVWFRSVGRPTLYTAIPCALILVTTIWSLIRLLPQYWADGAYPLVVSDAFLLVLSLGLLYQAFRSTAGRAIEA